MRPACVIFVQKKMDQDRKIKNPSILEFIKLSVEEQVCSLRKAACLLDTDKSLPLEFNLYYLNGYFVEELIDRSKEQIIEIIPFKQGYRLHSYMPVKTKQHSFFSNFKNIRASEAVYRNCKNLTPETQTALKKKTRNKLTVTL